MNIHCKYDELVDIAKLKPYPKNRNQHTPDQITRLAFLLREHGVRAPVIVATSPQKCIAKGHGTLEAMKLNGWTEAPVVYQEFEDEDMLYAFVQSDNAIASWAELDLAGINADLSELGPFDLDLLGVENFVADVGEFPHFDPGSEDEQGQLDEKQPIICPHCGKSFVKA